MTKRRRCLTEVLLKRMWAQKGCGDESERVGHARKLSPSSVS